MPAMQEMEATGWADGHMQAASVQSERATDIVTTIAATMRQMGVVGLPRNYEIFYEALTGALREGVPKVSL